MIDREFDDLLILKDAWIRNFLDIISVRISQPVKHTAAAILCKATVRCGNIVIAGRQTLMNHRKHSFPYFIRHSIYLQNLLRSSYHSAAISDVKQPVCNRCKQLPLTSILAPRARNENNTLIKQTTDYIHILPVNRQSSILHQSSIYI